MAKVIIDSEIELKNYTEITFCVCLLSEADIKRVTIKTYHVDTLNQNQNAKVDNNVSSRQSNQSLSAVWISLSNRVQRLPILNRV